MPLLTDCAPLRLGVRFSPGALVLVYKDNEADKIRKRIMPIRNFRSDSNVSFVAQDLKLRHSVLETIPMFTIEKMLRLLQEHLKGYELEESLETVNKEFSINPEEDLNKLDDKQIKLKKEIMDHTYNKNRIKPSDPEFVYDKRVEFEDNSQKQQSNWDSDGDDFWN